MKLNVESKNRYATILNVEGSHVFEAVKQCYASMWETRLFGERYCFLFWFFFPLSKRKHLNEEASRLTCLTSSLFRVSKECWFQVGRIPCNGRCCSAASNDRKDFMIILWQNNTD